MRETTTVTNRTNGTTVYRVKELNVERIFEPGETQKNVPVKELEALSNKANGKKFIFNNLFIHDQDVIRYLINGEEPPEYWLKEEDIPNWMNTCSLDEFKDALDFAPVGIKDLLKKYAVEVPLKDFDKRQAMLEQLDYDVTKAIELITSDDKPTEATKPARRASNISIKMPEQEKIVVK